MSKLCKHEDLDLWEIIVSLCRKMTVKPMKKTYSGFELSVIQNFICTKPERLDMIKENLPKFAKAINPYPVIVNYDTDIYAKEIYDLYNKYIDNLMVNYLFYNNLEHY